MRRGWRDGAAAAIACLLVASAVNNLVQANRAIAADTRYGTRDGEHVRLPNVLLIGAQKGGSSALAAWLFEQGVCQPKAFPGEPKSRNKEVHFFDNAERYKKGAKFYARRFEHCQGKALALDATPNYLPYPDRVKKTYKGGREDQAENLKIIMTLREPVARELSAYNHKAKFYREENLPRIAFWGDVVREDGELMSFGQYMNSTVLRGVNPTTGTCKQPFHSYWWCFSLYAPPLRRWLDLFDASQVLLLSYEEMVQDEKTFRWRVRSFLGMNSTSDSSANIKSANVQHSEHKLYLPPCHVQSTLSAAFRKANEELYDLLRRKTEPVMEQRPFPQFVLTNCSVGEGGVIHPLLDAS